VARRLGLDDRPLVLTVGRLIARKGHADLLAEWPRIRSACPDATWVVVGEGPERAALEAAVAGDPFVRFVGSLGDAEVNALRRRAALHVMPGRLVGHHVEGFGMAAVEAGVLGTPTVATDLGGVAEAVGDGGVVVPSGAFGDLADAVIELLSDDHRRATLGGFARARAEAAAWPQFAAHLQDAFGLVRTP
jgi:phosphatidylinositol alpha-1,6-mannosyltransferase